MKKTLTVFFSALIWLGLQSCQDTRDVVPAIDCNFPVVEVPTEEVDSIQKWLDAHGISADKDPRGFYYIIDSVGSEDRVEHCYDVVVDYKYYTFDGSYIDIGTNALYRIFAHRTKGFGYGLTLIGKEGKITLFLPPSLAYGEVGFAPVVGPNEYVIFELYLREFERNEYPYF